MVNTLYELSTEYNQIIDILENDEMPDEELPAHLEAVDEAFEAKANNIAILINTLQAEVQTIKSEIDRLKKRQESREKNIDRLKNYLKDNMEFCGKQKISGALHTISIRKSYKTEVSDEFVSWAKEHNKENLFTEKITYSPEKKLIKQEIEQGSLDCPYAKITESKNVIIK